MGIELEDDQVEVLLDYWAELMKWNRKINLVGPAPVQEQVVLHLVDGLSPLPYLEQGPRAFADIGSGGGIPGLVLKILRPRWTGRLIEARAKKAGFLRQAVRHLGLDGLEVFEGRLTPEIALELNPAFDLVVMRGFGSLETILDLTAGLVKPGGLLLSYKGPKFQEELDQVSPRLFQRGLTLEKKVAYRLPFIQRSRVLLFFRSQDAGP